jgi:hypothetical protein
MADHGFENKNGKMYIKAPLLAILPEGPKRNSFKIY